MRKHLFQQLFTAIPALSSLLGAIFIGYNREQGIQAAQWFLIAVAGTATFSFVVLEMKTYRELHTRCIEKGEPINSYMFDLLEHGDRVAIFSRDLTWAHEPRIRALFRDKSSRGELTVVVPNTNDLVDELKREGATVYAYPNLSYELRSRFTITQRGTAAPRVTVACPGDGSVLIERFEGSQSTVLTLAEDLLAILRSITKETMPKEQI